MDVIGMLDTKDMTECSPNYKNVSGGREWPNK